MRGQMHPRKAPRPEFTRRRRWAIPNGPVSAIERLIPVRGEYPCSDPNALLDSPSLPALINPEEHPIQH
jgi:hypothetical protein